MLILDTHFEDSKFAYAQIQREGMAAIYTQTHKASGVIRYEVVEIREAKAHIWPTGVETSEHEAYPSSGQWGTYGWTFFDIPRAQKHFGRLLEVLHRRSIKINNE